MTLFMVKLAEYGPDTISFIADVPTQQGNLTFHFSCDYVCYWLGHGPYYKELYQRVLAT